MVISSENDNEMLENSLVIMFYLFYLSDGIDSMQFNAALKRQSAVKKKLVFSLIKQLNKLYICDSIHPLSDYQFQ